MSPAEIIVTRFSPIAIVGRALEVPGASTPAELWSLVSEKKSALSKVDPARWRAPQNDVLGNQGDADRSYSDIGAYVESTSEQLDPVFELSERVVRRALDDAGGIAPRTGLVMGNLSFPSEGHSRYAESVWLEKYHALTGFDVPSADPRERFHSGLPAHLIAAKLGLNAGAYCLDAACASSLYAIELACRTLQDGEADMMVAGAINRADDLFIHVGFSTLGALSPTGQSRPFHREANGLVPAEGAAFVTLMRLEDARAEGRKIHGVIRGVGLKNDGRGRGMLAPSSRGQAASMRGALEQAGFSPDDVAYVECHATGTTVGDGTELSSLMDAYGARKTPLSIGSLKANLGHLITAAGAAGLIKVLEAMARKTLPPTPHLEPSALHKSAQAFDVSFEVEPWRGPLRAGVSAFGFGGNDAHLIVEDASLTSARPSKRAEKVLVCVRAMRASAEAKLTKVSLPLRDVRFPPNDLKDALAQQGWLLSEAILLEKELAARASAEPDLDLRNEALRDRTGVFIGMGCDSDVARYGARWRSKSWARSGWAKALDGTIDGDVFVDSLTSAGVIGTMPNIPANRLSSQFDLRGPSLTFSAEEASGAWALKAAARALVNHEIDLAIVGAVDLASDDVSKHALSAVGLSEQAVDGVVLFVLSREPQMSAHMFAALEVFTSEHKLHQPRCASLRPHAAAALFDLKSVIESKVERTVTTNALGNGGAQVVIAVSPSHAGFASAGENVQLAPPLLELEAHLPSPSATLPSPSATLPSPSATLPSPLSSGSSRASKLDTRAHYPSTNSLTTSMQSMPKAPSLPSVFDPPKDASPGATEPRAEASIHTEVATGTWSRSSKTPATTQRLSMSKAPRHDQSQSSVGTKVPAQHRLSTTPALLPTPSSVSAAASSAQVQAIAAYQQQLAQMHQSFVEAQAQLHVEFLQLHQLSTFAMLPGGSGAAQSGQVLSESAFESTAHQAQYTPPKSELKRPMKPAPSKVRRPEEAHVDAPSAQRPVAESAPQATPRSAVTPSERSVPNLEALAQSWNAKAASTEPASPIALSERPEPSAPSTANSDNTTRTSSASLAPLPVGPTFSREDLLVHASGEISKIFGPLFEQQDKYEVQVRMPEPPLLLADRVTGIDAEPGSMKKGTVWTETDVREDSWYLHRGRMPAGVMIESGQADLFLISYLGIDFLNQGERAYRLLGCELTYHGALPKVGETLSYDIHVDGHANQGPIRLFFFHYDCELRGTDDAGQPTVRKALSVRHGQAGFFTEEELADSAGVLWTPEEQDIVEEPRLDPPRVECTKTSFNEDELRAFAGGDVLSCFGPGFEYAAPHNRTPRIAGHKMHFFDRVDECRVDGGPWKRGYLRATLDISPDDWFFVGHFKNDPCMPGTLMFEGCLQAMATYMTSLGFTLDKDGWRFEPVPEEKYKLLCRGQVLPNSKKLTYEIFVEEVIDGDYPTIYADLLCTVDGLKAFHARRMGLRLVPDWPLDEWRTVPLDEQDPSPSAELVDEVHGAIDELARLAPPAASAIWSEDPERREFVFDYASLLACAWGKPSEAFGPMYGIFDSTRRVARLPGPPYHFMSRVTRIEGDLGACRPGAEIEIAYDIPDDIWYFRENAQAVMPFCVLLEAALQPCGWLASFVGSALTVDKDLSFRNLDGKGTVLTEVFPANKVAGSTFRTQVKITNVSATAGMIIESFKVSCSVDCADGTRVPAYELDTVFGFFPGEALENQVGLPTSDEQRAQLESENAFHVDLTTRPETYCGQKLRLANPMLLMLDRITAFDASGGSEGRGFVRGEKDVDPEEWFFKAHFFQDPVQPGSLGIEAFLQLLQFYAIESGIGKDMEAPRFEAIAVDHEHSWKYRGQVVPKNEVIGSTLEVLDVREDERGVLIEGRASLWVDGKRIYEAPKIAIRVVDEAKLNRQGDAEKKAQTPETEERFRGTRSVSGERTFSEEHVSGASSHTLTSLNIKADAWTGDHRPTFTVPALPMMVLVDRMLAEARRHDAGVRALKNVRVQRWVTVDPEARLKTQVRERDGKNVVELLVWREAEKRELSRFELAASAELCSEAELFEFEAGFETLSDLEPATSVTLEEASALYETGVLFHGDAFRLMTKLTRGKVGASSVLLPGERSSVPFGEIVPSVFDAATHAIPHDAMHTWHGSLPSDHAAYPLELDVLLVGDVGKLRTHHVRVEARLVELVTREVLGVRQTLPVVRMDIFALGDDESVADELVARLRLTEVLLPKGPIGNLEPEARKAFLSDKIYVKGGSLSVLSDKSATIEPATVKGSDWLFGTVNNAYGIDTKLSAAEREFVIGAKDLLAATSCVHPSKVVITDIVHADTTTNGTLTANVTAPNTPLSTKAVIGRRVDGTTAVEYADQGARLDLTRVKAFWESHFRLADWTVADLYYALCDTFVSEVVVDDPIAFSAIEGQSALFLANHQTGIESLLFGILVGALQKTPIVTLAKDDHRHSWLGRLIELGFQYPGAHDPGVIAFFDRADPASLPRIIEDLGARASDQESRRSLLIHVEGTRAKSARKPLGPMSGVFVDLAIKSNLPIVPVALSGGLPIEPVETRLEFPVGFGKQTYRLGTPILPSTLSGLPYKERNELVHGAIATLRSPIESPSPGNAILQKELSTGRPSQVARFVLEQLKHRSEATETLLTGDMDPSTQLGKWQTEFAKWLSST